MPFILNRLGTTGKYHLTPDKDKFSIGRNVDCDFTFTSPFISRQHCEILRVPPNGTLIIKNFKETNITYVDEIKLKNVAELRVGNKIGLGVPLSLAKDPAAMSNDKYVLLQLCDLEQEAARDESNIGGREITDGTSDLEIIDEPEAMVCLNPKVHHDRHSSQHTTAAPSGTDPHGLRQAHTSSPQVCQDEQAVVTNSHHSQHNIGRNEHSRNIRAGDHLAPNHSLGQHGGRRPLTAVGDINESKEHGKGADSQNKKNVSNQGCISDCDSDRYFPNLKLGKERAAVPSQPSHSGDTGNLSTSSETLQQNPVMKKSHNITTGAEAQQVSVHGHHEDPQTADAPQSQAARNLVSPNKLPKLTKLGRIQYLAKSTGVGSTTISVCHQSQALQEDSQHQQVPKLGNLCKNKNPQDMNTSLLVPATSSELPVNTKQCSTFNENNKVKNSQLDGGAVNRSVSHDLKCGVASPGWQQQQGRRVSQEQTGVVKDDIKTPLGEHASQVSLTSNSEGGKITSGKTQRKEDSLPPQAESPVRSVGHSQNSDSDDSLDSSIKFRWKRKKRRLRIFDDSEEEEEQNENVHFKKEKIEDKREGKCQMDEPPKKKVSKDSAAPSSECVNSLPRDTDEKVGIPLTVNIRRLPSSLLQRAGRGKPLSQFWQSAPPDVTPATSAAVHVHKPTKTYSCHSINKKAELYSEGHGNISRTEKQVEKEERGNDDRNKEQTVIKTAPCSMPSTTATENSLPAILSDDDDDELPDLTIPISCSSSSAEAGNCWRGNGSETTTLKRSLEEDDIPNEAKRKSNCHAMKEQETDKGQCKKKVETERRKERKDSSSESTGRPTTVRRGSSGVLESDLPTTTGVGNSSVALSVAAQGKASVVKKEPADEGNVGAESEEKLRNKVIKIKQEKESTDMAESSLRSKCSSGGVCASLQREEGTCNTSDCSDDDKDVTMYSQVNDVIWLSSDEEECSQSIDNDQSFDPPPSSPSHSMQDLFREEHAGPQGKESINSQQQNDVDNEEISILEDDQWLPVLSQSFLEDDGEVVGENKVIKTEPDVPESSRQALPLRDTEAGEECEEEYWPLLSQHFFDEEEEEKTNEQKNTSIPIAATTSEPDTARLSSPLLDSGKEEEEEEEEEEFWPELSQDFFADDNKEQHKSVGTERRPSHEQEVPGTSKSRVSVVGRPKHREQRTTELIQPIIPPQRGKNKTLLKNKCQEFYGKKSRELSRDRKAASSSRKLSPEGKSGDVCLSKNVSTSQIKHKGKHKKNTGSLKSNLISKYNLQSYRATVDNLVKGKHHLVEEKSLQDNKGTPQPAVHHKKSHLVSESHQKDENISVKEKDANKKGVSEAVPTVVAKVTKKTRSEKLTEVCLFPEPVAAPSRKIRVPEAGKTKGSSTVHLSHSSTSKSNQDKQTNNEEIGKNRGTTGKENCEGKGKNKEVTGKENGRNKEVTSKEKDKDKETTNKENYKNKEITTKEDDKNRNRESSDHTVPPQFRKSKVNLPPISSHEASSKADVIKQSQVENINPCAKSNKEAKQGILKVYVSKKAKTNKKVQFPSLLEQLEKVKYISPIKNQDKRGLLEARAREVLPRELLMKNLNMDRYFMVPFLYSICQWQYDWLLVYDKCLAKNEVRGGSVPVKPPPVVPNTNYPTLILYDSFKDYKEIFSCLMYLEVWENTYKDWVKHKESNMWLPALVDAVQPVIYPTISGPFKFWNIKLITLISSNQSARGLHPKQGSLVLLRIEGKKGKKRHIFGHVDNLKKMKKRMMCKQLEEACPDGEVCVIMELRVAKDLEVKASQMISVSNVSYLRNSSRMWEGLCKLPLSPLCSDILKPKPETFAVNQSTNKYLIDGMCLNDMQKKAVVEVADKCTLEPGLPKLSMIHGPPGTGKTRTVTALVAQMVRQAAEASHHGHHILLCAPSNAAVDELTRRLQLMRSIDVKLRVVRIGMKDSISTDVRGCSLDALVLAQITQELKAPRNASTRCEWERKKVIVNEAVNRLQQARQEKKSAEEIKWLENRLTELVRAKSDFEKNFETKLSTLSENEYHQLYSKWQHQFLINAEVVTTTLGGCLSGPMMDILHHNANHFTCCIVDEAGQCTEMETWLPLLLGMRKLVLVGDHKQLPATILSRLAQDKNLKQSLFQRFYHRLVVELERHDLVHSLNVQYRMHPEVAQWPAQHFYLGKLASHPNSEQHQQPAPYKPYLIFDVKDSREQRDEVRGTVYNVCEAEVVETMLHVLEPLVQGQKLGIITPYQRQRQLLEQRLAKFRGRINLMINTIDAFQGQERDLIILSFVRANSRASIGFLSQRERLNVALTRARKACYVVANLASMAGNQDWQALISNAQERRLVRPISSKQQSDKAYFHSLIKG